MGKRFGKGLKYFIPLAVVITGLAGTINIAVQQSYRQGANDPQIQMAEDGANSLNFGTKPQDLIGSDKVDMSKSLSPFLIIFDQHGGVLASKGTLNNSVPIPPQGVFDFVRSGGQESFGSIKKQVEDSLQNNSSEDRFTWQPARGVRIAAVITKYNGGFVLAGRNMREVEIREDNLGKQILFGWGATMLAAFIATLVFI